MATLRSKESAQETAESGQCRPTEMKHSLAKDPLSSNNHTEDLLNPPKICGLN